MTTGRVFLELTYGTQTKKLCFHIMRNCPHMIVLGIDTIKVISSGNFSFDLNKRWVKKIRYTLMIS